MYIEHSQLVQYFAHSSTTCQVLNTIASCEYQRTEHIQQWNLFKCQRFIFQHIVKIYLNTYWHMPVRPYERLDCCTRYNSCRNNTSARSFLSTTLFWPRANFLHQTYCWSCKTLVTIYWMHLRVNGIWATYFYPEKMNNRTLFLTGCFQR